MAYDIAKFLFRGSDPLEGLGQYNQALANANRNSTAALQSGLELRQQRELALKRMQLEESIAGGNLAARLARGQQLGGMYADQARARDERLAFDKQKHADSLAQEQGALDARMVKGLLDPLQRGNLNEFEAARAAAAAEDPSLRVLMPGETIGRSDPSIPSVDEAYPTDPENMRIVRGQRELYARSPAEIQSQEADIARRLTSPLAGNRWAGMGESVAGAGLSGADAGKLAITESGKEDTRDAMAERARRTDERAAAAATRQENRDDLQRQRLVLGQVDKAIAVPAALGKKLREEVGGLQSAENMFKSDIAAAQNLGLAQQVKATYGAAASDKESMRVASYAGAVDRLGALVNQWTAGGELPANFRDQMSLALGALRKEKGDILHRYGINARDSVYANSTLPWASDEEQVAQALRAYTQVTGEPVTREMYQAELRRFRASQGTVVPPASSGGQSAPWEPVQSDAGADNLGTTSGRPPLVPGATPPSPENRARYDMAIERMNNRRQPAAPAPVANPEDAELERLMRLVEEDYAQP